MTGATGVTGPTGGRGPAGARSVPGVRVRGASATWRRARGEERGAATVVVVALVGVLLLVAVGVAGAGGLVAAHRRAAAAADLAALAGASALQAGRAPCPAAARVVAAHEARMTRCTVLGEDVLVRAEVDGPPLPGRADVLVGRARAGPA